MDARLTLVAAGLIGVATYSVATQRGSPPIVAPSVPAVAPEDWFVAVKADLKAARIALQTGNSTVVNAIARSALTYRAQISQWTRVPPAANVYSVCGDLVIALAEIKDQPTALRSALALEDQCRDAIIPPRS